MAFNFGRDVGSSLEEGPSTHPPIPTRHHLNSDKTGTLTCNVMEMLKCTIGEHSYGQGLTQIGRAWRERNGLEIVEPPPRDPDDPVTPFVNINCPKLKVHCVACITCYLGLY